LKASAAGLLIIVALAGAGTLIVELSAVRLLAPWFGTSSGVWTNVIGVILLALATGYLAGARLSFGQSPRRILGTCLVLSAAATAWLPAIASPVAGWFLPEGVRLDQAAGLLTWGSLATAFVLFFPPAAILGCIGPLAVEALQRERGGHAGDAGGRVLAASTLGSIAGTFATTHVALPALGLTATFLWTGALLAVLGIVLILRSKGSTGAALPVVLPIVLVGGGLVLGAWLAPGLTQPVPSGGAVVLEARETAYQSARVVELEGAPVPRRLEVNEGFDSFQSVWQPETGLLPTGYYYNHFVLPHAWSRLDRRTTRPWNLLVLGLGAGTAFRVFEGAIEEPWHATGVEIDPGVVELARTWLDLAPEGTPELRVIAGWDARAALRYDEREYDQIVVDAYANQTEIPPHLSTVEFFHEAREKLVPGGWVSVNVGGFDLSDPVVEAVSATLAHAFERRALALRVPFARNVVVFARRDAQPPEPGSAEFDVPLARRVGAFALEGTWRWFDPDAAEATILTDDRNPIDVLQRHSIEEARLRLVARGS
jgi:spermidine synthase